MATPGAAEGAAIAETTSRESRVREICTATSPADSVDTIACPPGNRPTPLPPRTPLVLVHSPAGDRDQVRVVARGVLADAARDLVAVALGHADVEQRHLGVDLLRHAHGRLAVEGDVHVVPGSLEEQREARHRVV